MATIFTKILQGEIPCHALAEDDRYLAFLDIRPIQRGHTIVIPKREVDYLFDLDDADLGGILLFARPLARAIQQVVPCRRVGVMVAGLEVPHAHVHLVPITDLGDMRFDRARPAEPDELAETASAIRAVLATA